VTGAPVGRRVGAIARRIRSDYGGRDRAAEYRSLLETARDAGYELVSLTAFRAAVADGTEASPRRVLGLRHDIDVQDVAGNQAFLAAETAVGATATYYLRLATAPAHAAFAGRLRDAGFEVGYHYEEAATVAKRIRARDRAAVEAQRPAIEAAFQHDVERFRARYAPDLRSVASHGDWMNRRLGFRNNEFVTPELLAACGLEFEAYDASIVGRADAYVSDVVAPPAIWAGGLGPAEAIAAGATRIVMLTHERQWHTARLASLRADATRLFEGLAARLPA
jgi:hypothetical protein